MGRVVDVPRVLDRLRAADVFGVWARIMRSYGGGVIMPAVGSSMARMILHWSRVERRFARSAFEREQQRWCFR